MNDAQMTEALAQLAGVLWILALGVLVLAAYVALGYARNGVRATEPLTRALCGVVAACTFGTTLWASMLLAIGSEGVSYPIGFKAWELLGAWSVAVGLSTLVLLAVQRWPAGPVFFVGGSAPGAGAVLVHVLLLRAIDPRPGYDWTIAALVVAAIAAAAGCIAGLWLGVHAGRRGHARRGWRWASALAMGGTIMAAQELALAAVALSMQKASIHAHDVPLAALCVLGGLALPVVLLLLLLDLYRRTVEFEGEVRAQRRERRQRKRDAPASVPH